MDETTRLKTLQLFYAGLVVDAARQYAKQGVLERVTEDKKAEQAAAAPAQLARLGIGTPEGLFATFTEIFGCADWKVEREGELVRARASNCLACALAKRLGAPSPCAISCVNPFQGLAAALPDPRELRVAETLWEGKACVFELSPA
jgi:hypothetical protein